MTLATKTPVGINHKQFQTMLDFARVIYRLKNSPEYLQAIQSGLPEMTFVNPGYPSILMGYDFHLTADGPKLIEINNNAGGLFEKDDGWIPQCEHREMPGTIAERIVKMFPEHWQHIAIMDESIIQQYMYPEMQAYAELLSSTGKKVSLVSPEELILKDNDCLYVADVKVDGIYNRHTDFYLEEPTMLHIRKSFMSGSVDLNPYPRSYALIGDKNRMVDWWREGLLEKLLTTADLQLVRKVVPETHLLAEYDQEAAWSSRNSWVFKPAARHGGKGVLLGKSISKKRFLELEAQSTVLQKFIPASQIEIEGGSYKFDLRLYMHGEKLIALAGRAWNGQITNFREEGSGWTPICLKN